MTDSLTKDWIRNPSDDMAVGEGCRFDQERGEFVCNWIQHYLRLYEGDFAGQPMILLDWARDATMRLFGWVRWSEKWRREVRRFRQASVWCAKKQGKSPVLAAWGLYLLCGDGEPGAKIFLAAKDGRQAREIAGKHAIEMLRQSAELMSECKINQVTAQITHLPSRSILVPLASSNENHQQSKEGINGSVLIDEVHVVDRDLVRRISRAGISRSEPLQIEVSTAGNNPDGYGRERFDYARLVEMGHIINPGLFALVYAAPQDLDDKTLDESPMEWGRMANPAMGATVDPEEYLEDYRQSKKSLQNLLDFKMYRLNIWQKGSNPWLREGDWQNCRRDFTEADLAGRECYGGLDLSRTTDLSSLVLVFPEEEPETYSILSYFWMCRKAAEDRESLASFLEWGRAGHLQITPGDVIDYGFIRSTFRGLSKQFNILELAYDPRFAEETTQNLSDGVADSAGKVIEEGTGVPRVAFPQTDNAFAAPTEEFERLVIAGRLRHNGNPVMDWQAAHAQAMRKISKVKRVVKENKDSHKTVDGIVAGIMALGRAMLRAEAPSVYETRGIITIGPGGDVVPAPVSVPTAGRDPDDWDDDDGW